MPTQTEMIGKYVGDYQITEQLGEGGMGVVFKGVHPMLQQVVAIKMLHPTLLKAEAIKERFKREAMAMARLRHPNILQLFNFIDSPDGCFIVMEFVEGKTFESLLEEAGLLPPDKAIELFLPVLSAMSYAHSSGIIHRDIKPSNVMLLNGNNVVKVMDFGTAKMAGGPQLTAAGMTLGTVVYMSPEQLMGRDLSPQADIYSLGVTLYELTTGRLPFYHDNEMQLMKMIMKEPPPPPSAAYPAMPRELERVILHAIEKDMSKRYKTADEFAKDLEKVKAALASRAAAGPAPAPSTAKAAAPPTPPPPTPQPAPARTSTPPPEVEDTQSIARLMAQQKAGAGAAAAGTSPLVIVGAVLAGLGLAGGLPLTLLVQPIVIGIAVLGGLVLLGAILLIIGLTAGKRPAAGAPPSAMEQTLQREPPQGPIKSPVTPIPAAEKRVCPNCGKVLLPAMTSCPFCAPAPAAHHEGTRLGAAPSVAPAAPPEPPPASFGVPGQQFIDVVEGANRGLRIELGQQPITLGRSPDNNVVLKDASVSGHHARIDFYQGKFFLSDLQSSNGTYVNNARIEQSQLKHKDVIVMGGSRMAVNLG